MALALLTGGLALLIGYVAGGRLSAAPGVRLTGIHLLVAAFFVQLGEPLVSHFVLGAYPIGLAVSATLMVQFVARNPLVPGVALAGLGLLLNTAVVLVNGAMPVSMYAAARAGIPTLDLSEDVRHEALDASTRLPWLADVIPAPLPFRPEVISPGDVLLAAGIGLFVLASMLPRPRPVYAEATTPAQIVQEGRSQERAKCAPAAGADHAGVQRAPRSTTRDSDSTTRGSYS